MFVATARSDDPSQPHRGGMDCPTQPDAAPTGLGTILMDIVGYKHVTPTGFGISRRVRRRPTTDHEDQQNPFLSAQIRVIRGWMAVSGAKNRPGVAGRF